MLEPPRKVTFSALIAQGVLEIGDGYRAKLEELGGNGPIFLRAGLLSEGGFRWDAAERFDADLVPKLKVKMGRPGDTMVTTKGNSLGRTAFVHAGSPSFVYSPHLSYWRTLKPEHLSPRFIYYWSKGPEFDAQLHAMAHGTDMAPYLSLTDQRRLRITLPKVSVQDGITDILGALDDKIACNDSISSNIDQLLQSLFCKLITLPGPTSHVPLYKVALVNRRKVSPAPCGWLRYIDISSVSAGNVSWPERTPWGEAPSRARRGVMPGDTIWSTVRPGRRSYALILSDDPELVVSTGFAVLTPFKVGPAFFYEAAKRDEFVRYLESVAEGSAYPAVRAERYENAPIPLPPVAQVDEFEEIALPLRLRSNAAQEESRVLAQLRDTLLPRLMSGEMRVRQAEQIVEDAT